MGTLLILNVALVSTRDEIPAHSRCKSYGSGWWYQGWPVPCCDGAGGTAAGVVGSAAAGPLSTESRRLASRWTGGCYRMRDRFVPRCLLVAA